MTTLIINNVEIVFYTQQPQQPGCTLATNPKVLDRYAHQFQATGPGTSSFNINLNEYYINGEEDKTGQFNNKKQITTFEMFKNSISPSFSRKQNNIVTYEPILLFELETNLKKIFGQFKYSNLTKCGELPHANIVNDNFTIIGAEMPTTDDSIRFHVCIEDAAVLKALGGQSGGGSKSSKKLSKKVSKKVSKKSSKKVSKKSSKKVSKKLSKKVSKLMNGGAKKTSKVINKVTKKASKKASKVTKKASKVTKKASKVTKKSSKVMNGGAKKSSKVISKVSKKSSKVSNKLINGEAKKNYKVSKKGSKVLKKGSKVSKKVSKKTSKLIKSSKK